uniref:Uncharacterized protein n=1 Tax=Moniliophthora roreri TaxID=221103 RepID=A0A0W0GFE0_MONRR
MEEVIAMEQKGSDSKQHVMKRFHKQTRKHKCHAVPHGGDTDPEDGAYTNSAEGLDSDSDTGNKVELVPTLAKIADTLTSKTIPPTHAKRS